MVVHIKEFKHNCTARNTSIDLSFIVENLGKRRDGELVLRVANVRRLFRLIIWRADTDDFAKADDYISRCSNTKAKEIWADEKRKHGNSV